MKTTGPKLRAAITAVAVLGLAACSESKATSEATVPVQISRSAKTEIARRKFFREAPRVWQLNDRDYYAVPETINPKYIDELVHVFDHLHGEAIRIAKADPKNGTQKREFKDLLVATNSGRFFDVALRDWDQRLINDPDLKHFKKEPGDYQTFVERVIRAGPSCIVVQVESRGTNVFKKNFKTSFPKPNYMAFVARSMSGDYTLNPAPWVLNYWDGQQNGNEPKDACSSK